MLISKVLKKIQAEEKSKKLKDAPIELEKKYPTSQVQAGTGFHAKANSQKGAERIRSIGNRNSKPPR